VVLQYQRILSPRTVNEAKFGLNRANYHNYTFGTAPVAVNPGDFDGVSDTSLDTEVGTTFAGIDNWTTVLGRHTLKFGVEVRRIRLNNSGNTLTTSMEAIVEAASNHYRAGQIRAAGPLRPRQIPARGREACFHVVCFKQLRAAL
jgi:hypothetical protein